MKKKYRVLVLDRKWDLTSDEYSVLSPISWGYGIPLDRIKYQDYDTVEEAEDYMKDILPFFRSNIELTIIPIYTHDTGTTPNQVD